MKNIKFILVAITFVVMFICVFQNNAKTYVNAETENAGSLSRLSPTHTPEPTPIVSDNNEYTYSLYSYNDGGATIREYIGDNEDIVIPEYIDGNKVVSIGAYAFKECENIKSVIVPGSIKNLSNFAFADCLSLKHVTLQEGLESINYYSFSNCTSLEVIDIPSTVKYIGSKAFKGTDSLKQINISKDNDYFKVVDGVLFNDELTELIRYPVGDERSEYSVPEGVNVIIDSSFEGADSLETVILPNSVNTIENAAFKECSKLKCINIPEGVTNIDYNAFSYCASIEELSIPASVASIGSNSFMHCDSLREVTIDSNNENFTSIDGIVFSKDKSLLIYYPDGKEGSNYSVPEGVISIESGSFDHCKYLESIEIPGSVTNIHYTCFDGAINLSGIIVDENNGNYSSSDGVLFNKDQTTLIRFPQGKKDKTYEIPDTVNNVQLRAFVSCDYIEKVNMPDSVFEIGNAVFLSCDSLKRVDISSNVTMLPYNLFSSCYSLETVVIPASVTDILLYVFRDCDNFTIYGETGSYVEKYAEENGYSFSTDTPPEYIEQTPIATESILPTSTPSISPTYTPGIDPTEIPIIHKGDVNNDGNIDAEDALLVLMKAAKLQEIDIKLADVSYDDKVDASDALLILKYAANLINSFDNI